MFRGSLLMKSEFAVADPDLISRTENHRRCHARAVDESPVYADTIGYIEQALIGALQQGVIARDRVFFEYDIILVAAADSKDPIARQMELADLSVDLDFKISRWNVAHGPVVDL
jgi:hypothetical protein